MNTLFTTRVSKCDHRIDDPMHKMQTPCFVSLFFVLFFPHMFLVRVHCNSSSNIYFFTALLQIFIFFLIFYTFFFQIL